ncbi:Protein STRICTOSIDINE SYNTHASE-LIKE 10 [Capsicum baccatum]|uniref:Protein STRICTOSIDINE SYNTHASE-LIKE 10 n=1 Tax=Capsicum baccatum TaxID=33114 RepID=A0A2G2VP11_CAPBA|nr:Protein STRICTOSIDINE SYNTHASE-LIKE 10 [Capsicum baccatum]
MCIPLPVGEHDKSTKAVTVLLRGLAFANGVALSKDKSIVLVAENSTSRIVRYWLKGPSAGQHYTFIDLTGYPENIGKNSKGEFWVACIQKIVAFKVGHIQFMAWKDSAKTSSFYPATALHISQMAGACDCN